MYILYQVNGKKMSLQSLIISCFTSTTAKFERDASKQSAPFPQAMPFLWNFQRENWGKPAFKFCDLLACPSESRFKNQNNYLGEIDDQIKRIRMTVSFMLNTKFYKFKKED